MYPVNDLIEIQQLCARFAFYLDTFQGELWLPLWAEDGSFDLTATSMGLHVGPQGRKGFADQVASIMSQQVHCGGSHVIDIVSDREATGKQYSMVEGVSKAGGKLRAAVYYDDVYVKVNGRWRFKSRKVTPLMPFDVSGFLGG